jgi:putative membrane protein insertion efficiency factor
MKLFFIFFIKFYQQCISPFFPRRCNFEPSCSQYAIDAIMTFGIIRGCYLAFKRIIKCTSNREWTFDPVIKK